MPFRYYCEEVLRVHCKVRDHKGLKKRVVRTSNGHIAGVDNRCGLVSNPQQEYYHGENMFRYFPKSF